MNEQILYYGAWAAILELLFWAGLGVLALRRYRKRRASHVVIKSQGLYRPLAYRETYYSPENINWQSRIADFYKGEEE